MCGKFEVERLISDWRNLAATSHNLAQLKVISPCLHYMKSIQANRTYLC